MPNLVRSGSLFLAVACVYMLEQNKPKQKEIPIKVEPTPIHIHIERVPDAINTGPELKGRFHDKTTDKIASDTPNLQPLYQNAFNNTDTPPSIPKDDIEDVEWEGIIVTASWCAPCAIWKTAESQGQKEIVKEGDIQLFSNGFDSFTIPEYQTGEPRKFYVLTKPELRKYKKKRIYIMDYDKYKSDLAMFNIKSVPTYIRLPASNPALEKGEVLSAPSQPSEVLYFFNTGKPPKGRMLQRVLKPYQPWLNQ